MAITNQRWPTDLAPETCTFTRTRNDARQVSPISRQATVLRFGRPLWQAELTWTVGNDARGEKLRYWLEGLDGFVGTVQLWDFNSFAIGGIVMGTTTLSANAAVNATSVSVQSSVNSARLAYAGGYVQIGRRLYTCANDVVTGSTGAATFDIQQKLVVAANSGDALRFQQAACEMQLVDQNWAVSGNATSGLKSVRASFLETVTDV